MSVHMQTLPTPMSEPLLRQRRNLMIVTVLLWFQKYGGVTISKFSLAGFEVAIMNPKAINQAIWIAFAYFLYRYAQYFYTDGRASLTWVHGNTLNKECAKVIYRAVEAEPGCRAMNGVSYENVKLNNWSQEIAKGTELMQLPIRRRKFYPAYIKTAWHIIIIHNVFTDYILPFLLAAFVILYYGYGWIS